MMFGDWDAREAQTLARFRDPQPGDRFHEMFTFWLYVVWRDGNLVATLDSPSPCTFPDDGRLWIGTVDDLRERWTDSAGPTVIFEPSKEANGTAGWFAYAAQRDGFELVTA